MNPDSAFTTLCKWCGKDIETKHPTTISGECEDCQQITLEIEQGVRCEHGEPMDAECRQCNRLIDKAIDCDTFPNK